MTFYRGRRLRSSETLRGLVRETHLSPRDLVQPYFVVENDPQAQRPIGSMPGQFQLGMDAYMRQVELAVDKGLQALILFGIPVSKDAVGSSGYSDDGVVQEAVRRTKDLWPELVVITDVCLCEYTDHGHCGVIKQGEILNDPTLELLAKTALSHARAGADIVAPSDMMDGRVGAIRQALDQEGYVQTPILSYAVKYASAYYGPFREAAESAPSFGDRRGYQMDPANGREGLREAEADLAEGADILMVKPAGPYQDVIRMLRDTFEVPLAAYQVSGEYSLIKAAGEKGWLDEERVALESLTGIKRAGADIILSYFTESLLPALTS